MATDPPSVTAATIRFPTWEASAPIAVGPQRSEAELRAALRAFLAAQGLPLAERIVCVAGEPDLVSATRDLIVEVKWRLTRKALCSAIGQLLLYRQAINPRARVVIVGYPAAETLAVLPLVAEFGVEVVCWQDAKAEGEGIRDEAGQGSLPDEMGAPTVGAAHGVGTDTMAGATTPGTGSEPAGGDQRHGVGTDTMGFALNSDQRQLHRPSPPAFRLLRWNVAVLAQTHGIKNPSRLGTQLQVGRQGLYAIWNGTAGQVMITMLGRLAHFFQVAPGHWFVWEAAPGAQAPISAVRFPPSAFLRWNVAAQAEARGLDMAQLGFQAQIHTASMRPIWRGEAQAVAPSTLGRLAQVLDLAGQPFAIGDLFRWQAEP